jgi:hypothetical protein
MPCESTRTRPDQTMTERKIEVREAIAALSVALVSGRARAIIDKRTGAIAFQGWTEGRDARVTDLCGLRLIGVFGSASAKQAIAKAEMLAGRTVNRQAAVHGHAGADGTMQWHHNH